MTPLRLASFLVLSLVLGCSGPKPGPPPPAPAEAGVASYYQKAYAALSIHPAVQAFAAEHLDPSETLAISVSEEVVPLPYGLFTADVAQSRGPVSFERLNAIRDSLTALASADRFTPETNPDLPLLSMRQQRPLVLFFGKMNDGRLPAQLYPNPYRRKGFEAIREGQPPGLALLVVFDNGAIADIHTGTIMTE